MKTASFIAIALSSAILTACGGGGSDESPSAPATPIVNSPPVAQAGVNQNVTAGAVVTLDASNSSDSDKDSLTYKWALTTRPAGSSAALIAPTSVQPTFTADAAGVYVATVIVNDGQANSTEATVTITASVNNSAPVANAGIAQNVVSNSTVTLDASASSDANGDSLTYFWTLTLRPAGSTATLTTPNTVRPTFKADVAGAYSATLVVNDGQTSSAAASVAITATEGNAVPFAQAGTAQNVVTGSTVTLDGSASTDANNDALSYLWSFTSVPTGSAATLNARTTAKPSFTADIAGTYVASLVVNDGKINSEPANVTVTASTANAAPVANAGAAQTVVLGSVVTLDGSASADADKDALTYQWTLTSKPVGSIAVLNSATTAKPSFTADVEGDYVATLIVNDGKISSPASNITLKATATPAITLLSVSNSFFNGSEERKESWPYASSGTKDADSICVGSPCPTAQDVATFKLSAVGQSFTVIDLQAINRTNGSTLAPLVSGLVNGQVIAAGQTATFILQSPFTNGRTVDLQYSFTIKETSESFSYSVRLRTN